MSLKKTCAALLLAGLSVSPAFAVTTDGYEIPYVGAGYAHEFGDGARDSAGGNGFQLNFGLPVSWWRNTAVELDYYNGRRSRHLYGSSDYQNALMVDLVRDAGLYGWPEGSLNKYLPQFKPFALIGLGGVQEDVRGSKHYHVGGELGGGLLFPLPWYGIALRTEARLQAQANHQSVAGRNALVDYRLAVGVQVPLTPFFKSHTAPTPPAQECGVAVVDLNGKPRTDCETDSDHDGVPDSIDQCPGTPEGMPVDAKGCPAGAIPEGAPAAAPTAIPPATGSADCTSSYVVGESYRLKGVRFANDTATLTEDSKTVLDEVVRSLNCAKDYDVEIAGYTDSKGSKTYNLKLSARRAEAVRDYLASKGVTASRLSAKGYGKANPRASNKMRKGREQNRRVEIKLIVI